MGQRQKPETEAKSYLTNYNKTQRQAQSHVLTLAHIAYEASQYSASETPLGILTKA